jgi:ketosteroid isomerase-like protein
MDWVSLGVFDLTRTLPSQERPVSMTQKETILAFVDAINAHDIDRLGELMADSHTFVDPHGNVVTGRESMIAAWHGYFEWFPDYQIEVDDIYEREGEFVMFGWAAGSFKGNGNRKWRLPAAWRASVRNDQVARWQVVADTKVPFESMSGG